MADYVVPAATNLANTTTVLGQPIHPYYPLNAAIPDYVSNEWTTLEILAAFFPACAALFTSTYFIAKRVNKRLGTDELLTIMWFVLSGAIHILFEGHYVFNFDSLAGKQTIIGQMWKEYAFSDSRYLTKNTFVLSVEAITVLCWGPGCLLVAGLIMLRHPLRYPMQSVISLGQLYGDTLYYATSLLDHFLNGIEYSRPEAFYFWFYFVAMNAIWIVVPGFLMYQSIVESTRAIAKTQQLTSLKKVL